MDSLLHPVLQLTWNSNKTVQVSGQYYRIPDNFDFTPTPSADQTSTNQVYTSLTVSNLLYQSQTVGFSGVKVFGIRLLPGMYTTSSQASYFSAQNRSLDYTGYSYLLVKSWKVQADYFAFESLNTSLFDPNFVSIMKNLPTTFSSATCPSFLKLFTLFGTHFFTCCSMGRPGKHVFFFLSESLFSSRCDCCIE